ncbi:cell wall hydrolase [Chitinilyticum aquatile]|uniref:cell wall hydrolase n=1 Tax=Chitinilyticum aquatile TaxID=362520 RepID=UPI00054D1CFA|nr:cell wall hydrolase [Chitinilyticum aquatile]
MAIRKLGNLFLLLLMLAGVMTAASASFSYRWQPRPQVQASAVLASAVTAAPASAPASAPESEPQPLLSQQDRDLLVLNVFNEARGDTPEGMRAVLAVTMARVESACFPDTVQEVIYQPRQFSWTHQRGTARTLAAAEAREPRALARVEEVVDDFIEDGAPAGEELLYHARTVNPVWASSSQLRRSKVMAYHVFYRHRFC